MMPGPVRPRIRRFLSVALVVAVGAVAIFSPGDSHQAAEPVAAQTATTVQVYGRGLINPKEMAFTADGTLYIAESGKPGDVTVPLPVGFGRQGPYR